MLSKAHYGWYLLVTYSSKDFFIENPSMSKCFSTFYLDQILSIEQVATESWLEYTTDELNSEKLIE